MNLTPNNKEICKGIVSAIVMFSVAGVLSDIFENGLIFFASPLLWIFFVTLMGWKLR
jgi:hypothetical protein